MDWGVTCTGWKEKSLNSATLKEIGTQTQIIHDTVAILEIQRFIGVEHWTSR